MKLEERFTTVYAPLLQAFVEEVKDVNTENCPSPFLPVYGKGYEQAAVRIMFMGWETRNSFILPQFLDAARNSPRTALHWFEEEFDDFEFLEWRGNSGLDFWGFNLKFLARMHGIADWTEITANPEQYRSILNSFVWANSDSIERHSVTAQQKGVHYDDWQKIKTASLVFDKPQLAIDTFEPDIMLFLKWDKKEDWFTQNLVIEDKKIINKHLWYYKVKTERGYTHIFWTYHPLGMAWQSVDVEDLMDEIMVVYSANK